MRQMAAMRKGGSPTLPTQENGPDENQPDGSDEPVTCPNCKCEFDEETMKVTKPGLPLADPSGGGEQPEGAELDMTGGPVSGPKGSAYDGTIGQQAQTAALSALFGGSHGAGARL